jgi:hypothetical protein
MAGARRSSGAFGPSKRDERRLSGVAGSDERRPGRDKKASEVGEDSKRVETLVPRDRRDRERGAALLREGRRSALETESAEASMIVRGHVCCDLQTHSHLESEAHGDMDVFQRKGQALV